MDELQDAILLIKVRRCIGEWTFAHLELLYNGCLLTRFTSNRPDCVTRVHNLGHPKLRFALMLLTTLGFETILNTNSAITQIPCGIS